MLVYYLLSGLQPKSNMQSCSGSFNYFNFSQPNVGLIYALQRAVGISADIANGNFGDATNAALKNVQLSVGSTGLLVKIVKYGLYLNSMYSGDFSESFGSDVATSIIRFRKFMKYPNKTSGIADYTVIKGLVTSNGDTGRDSIALDTATQLTAEDVKHFRDYGFSIVGRYLTGTVGTDFKPKNLTLPEIKTILDGGMKFFPIYEDGGYVETYFTGSQGKADARTAIKAALNLGLPAGTVIYFAVDVDLQEGDIAGTVIPYIRTVQDMLSSSIYQTGIYGTRNVCLHAEKAGIGYSFVANMSYGWSGNLGFKMPSNWAFDQFVEYPIYGVDIDQIASSGLDVGTSKVSESSTSKNSAFFSQLQSVEQLAFAYIQSLKGTIPVPREAYPLIAQFNRQFNYTGLSWSALAGTIDTAWLAKANDSLNVSTLKDIEPLFDNVSGIQVDVAHLMATLNALLFLGFPSTASGIQDLGGWLGDLLTAMEKAHQDVSKFTSFYESIYSHIGTAGVFSTEDVLADVDAINLYSNIKGQQELVNGRSFSLIRKDYFLDFENENRFNSFLNNRFNGNSNTMLSDTQILLKGGTGDWGAAYSVALFEFRK